MVRRFAQIALLLAAWCGLYAMAPATSPWSVVVGRASDDRDADLIAALIAVGRFDDAAAVCGARQRETARESDAAAKWAIRLSQVESARRMSGERFDDSDLEAVRRPVVELLDAYGEHRRRWFLEAQLVAAGQQAAMHSVLRAAVSPSDEAAREIAFRRLLTATTDATALADRVGQARARLDSDRDPKNLSLIADLGRLQQELQVDAVSLALMQTELFPRGSDDQIAAATKAERAAEEAITRLPKETAARREVERLKVESILRAGQVNRAEAELAGLVRAFGTALPSRVESLSVRVDLAAKRMERAGARLAAYYGDSPDDAPRSVDMDLARMEFLLRSNAAGVGQWLDAIERRGGAYARRRAEAISLALLGSRGSGPARAMVDPSLVAAQGQDWLRRGDPGRAGELLSAAAAAESDPDRAIKRAGEAAAAMMSAARTVDAAAILADVSMAKPTGKGASANHLQAALLVASIEETDVTESLEEMLRTHLEQWPGQETASAARRWLRKMLVSQRRFVEAAEVATAVDAEQVTAEDLTSIVDDWRTAFHATDPATLGETSMRFEKAFGPLLENPPAQTAYRLAAALLVDRDTLSRLHDALSEPPKTFADALVRFRQRGVATDPLADPPEEYVGDATWRLMLDGRKYPQLRGAIAELVAKWPGTSQPSLDQCERLLWQGQTQVAVAKIRDLIDRSPRAAELTSRAAQLLGSTGNGEARRAAIELWDELAFGSPQGSDQWHKAKLAAIDLHKAGGNDEEARRRARYILLTAPNIDASWKDRYEAASK